MIARRRRGVVEELEPRILYSADFAPALAPESGLDSVEMRTLDSAGDFVQTDAQTSSGEDLAPETSAGEPAEADAPPTPSGAPQVDLAGTPLAFERNVGQTDASVDFLARGSGYTMWLEDGDAVIALRHEAGAQVVRLDVLGANADPAASGEGRIESTTSYLMGDADSWRSDVASYAAVRYDQVYDGIDLRYYGNGRALEYDFLVDAGASVDRIRLAFDGAHGVSIAANGDLVVMLDDEGRSIAFKAPISYQDTLDGRVSVDSRYVLHDDGSIGFEVGSYDLSQALVIDPVLWYGTYLGSTGTDQVLALTVDAAGSVYVTGSTTSAAFPLTTGSYVGNEDVFVAKFSGDLSTLLYSTIIGGGGDDTAYSIAVDAAGSAYVTGATSSANFPTQNPYQSVNEGGIDAFAFKLDATGTSLAYSTYLGGAAGATYGYYIAVDAAGSAYVAGETTASDFDRSAGAADTTFGGTTEAFVTKLSQTGDTLVYSTFVGGTGDEFAYSIAVDAAGRAVVTGGTTSTMTASANAYQTTIAGGSRDVYVARLNASGSALDYFTYLGGNNDDQGLGLALDAAGKIYVVGIARNAFDTTPNAYMTANPGGASMFLSILDPSQANAAQLVYSTYLGSSSSNEELWGVDVDPSGRVYVAGAADGAVPTTADAVQSLPLSGHDIYVAVIDPASGGANDLVYASFLGGSGTDKAVAGNYANGRFYVGGYTTSPANVATTGTYDASYAAAEEGLVGMFVFNSPPTALGVSPTSVDENTDTSAGHQLGTLATIDPDSGDTFTYSIAGGTDAALFSISGDRLVLTAGVLDYETRPAYSVLVRSTDSFGAFIEQAFNVTVSNLNEAPSVSFIPDQTIDHDSAVTFDFTIADPESAATALVVTATSSNQVLLPDANIALSGTGATRTVMLTPAAMQAGSATVTVRVSDGTLDTYEEFVLIVNPENLPPTIGAGAFTVAEGSAAGTGVGTVAAVDPDVEKSFDKIYFSDYFGDRILRANLDGSNQQTLVSGLSTPGGVAVDYLAGKVYWADSGTDRIQRANFDGSGMENFLTGLADPVSLKIDASARQVYWIEVGTGTIHRANLDGTGLQTLPISGLSDPRAIDLDVSAGKLYWVDDGSNRVARANLDGSGVETLVTGLNAPTGIALDVGAGKLHWSDAGTSRIGRANLDGSAAQPAFISTSNGVKGIAVDVARDQIYWTEDDNDRIRRANLDGTGITNVLSTGLLSDPSGIALGPSVPALSYSITNGNTGGAFAIDASGSISVANPAALDFETTPTYTLTVRVQDAGGAVSMQDITVALTNANETPTGVVLTGGAVAENTNTSAGYAVGTLSTSDPDAGDIFTYTVSGGADQSRFSISGDQLVLTDGVLNFEVKPSYSVQVTSTDAGGLSVLQTFVVSVTDVNEAPSISVIGSQAIPEDSSTGAISFTISDPETAAGSLVVTAFSSDTIRVPNANIVLGGSGASRTVTVTPAPNAYGGPVNITVRVSDGVNNPQRVFSVAITGIADTPNVTNAATNEDTQTSSGLVITRNAADGMEVTHFKITGIAGGTLFQSNGTTPIAEGQFITVAEGNTGLRFTPAPDSTANGSFNVQASTSPSNGGLGGGIVTATITVAPVNDAPVVTSNGGGATAGVTVQENTTLVTTVTATDVDVPAQTLAYSIAGGVDAARFTIDSGSGVLRFITAPDYEAPSDAGLDNVYEVVVRVSDGGADSTQALSVTVGDMGMVFDQFNAVGYAGNDGTQDWSSNWQELGEANGASSGTVRVASGALRIGGDEVSISGRGAAREADLAGATVARLTFDYRRVDVDGGGGSVSVQVSGNGGGTWTTLQNYSLSTFDGSFQSAQFDISAYAAANTQVRFVGSGTTEAYFYADNVRIEHNGSAVNTPPLLVSDGGGDAAALAVMENASVVTAVMATDADLPAQPLSYSIGGGVDQGFFVIDAASGVLTFVSAPDYEAPADADLDNVYEVLVRVSDGNGGSDDQTLMVSVLDANDAPSGLSLSNSALGETIDTSAGYAVGTLSTTDADLADTHSYAVVGGIDQAKFGISGDQLILTDGVLDFETRPSYEVTVRATDSGGLSADQTFIISVLDVNEAPSVSVVADQTITEGGSSGVLTFTIGDLETAAGSLTVTATSSDPVRIPDANLLLSGSGAIRTLTVTPAADAYGGPVSITLEVSDGMNVAQSVFTVEIAGVADTPSVTNAVTAEDTQSTGGLVITRNAADGAEVTHFKITGIAGGALHLADGVTAVLDGAFITAADGGAGLRFTPAANSTAPGSFDVQASTSAGDAGLGGGIATATISVLPQNDAPVALSDSFVASANTTLNVAAPGVLANDLDVDGGALTAVQIDGPANGVLVLNADGSFSYTPDAGFEGLDSFRYAASDGALQSGPVVVEITVNGVNDAPTGVTLSNASVPEGTDTSGGFVIGVLGTTDVDVGDTHTYVIAGGADAARFAISGGDLVLTDGVLDHEAAPTYQVIVRSTDAGGLAFDETFVVTVTDLDEAPTLTPIADQTLAEGGSLAALAFVIGDPETAAGVLIVSVSSNDALRIPDANLVLSGTDANRTLTVTPAAEAFGGPVTITLSVSDGLNTTWATFDVTITPVLDSVVVVDTVDDVADGDTSSIDALLMDRGADGFISLREAIEAANNSPNAGSPDQILFDIAGPGPHFIDVLSALPVISDAVVIDGTSDPDFSGTPVIEVHGDVFGIDGLVLMADGSTVRGLSLIGFDGGGIVLEGGGNTIVGNYLGIEADGTTVHSNGYGIVVRSDSNVIGGAAPGERNVISGNAIDGIWIDGGGDNIVRGNYIGTDPSGTLAIGNAEDGIWLLGGIGNVIGGTGAGQGNVLSGNQWSGLAIQGSQDTLILGNYIGVDASGTGALGNANAGVMIQDGAGTVIGGLGGAQNVIAHNGLDGVAILAGTGHSVLENAIYANGDLGIDLLDNGVTANDAGDVDANANLGMNFPVIYSVVVSGGNVTIEGEARPGATVRFYKSPDASSGYGEGQTFLDSVVVAGATPGNIDSTARRFSVIFAAGGVAVGDRITATATDAVDNTSEFSRNVVATAVPPGIGVTPTAGLSTTEDGGTASFSVVLLTQPTSGVTIALSSSDTTEGFPLLSSLTFTTSNWNVAQTVTVAGRPDGTSDGNVAYTIVLAPASSSDPAYRLLDPSDVALQNVDTVNDAPTALNLSNLSESEGVDTTGGRFIGTLSTTDPETYDAHTYSIVGGADAANFSLSGDALLLDAGVLDFETKSSYVVTVRTTDLGGLTRDRTFSIGVTNVNDAPVLVNNGSASVAWGGSAVIGAGTLSVADDDNAAAQLVYTLTSAPTGGTLRLSGSVVAVSGTFTQADIDSGRLAYVHDAASSGPDMFSVSVSDGAAGLGPVALEVAIGSPAPVIIVTDPVAPPPTGPTDPTTDPTTDPGTVPTDPGSGSGDSDGSTGTGAVADAGGAGGDGGDGGAGLFEDPAGEAGPGTPAGSGNGQRGTVRIVFADTMALRTVVLGGGLSTVTAFGDGSTRDATQPLASVSDFALADLTSRAAETSQSVALSSFQATLGDTEWVTELDRMRQDIDAQVPAQSALVVSSVAVTGSLSVGYVLWLLRGGLLLSSLLSSLPAWTVIDPMPVLSRSGHDDEDEGDDPLEKLFGRARAALGLKRGLFRRFSKHTDEEVTPT